MTKDDFKKLAAVFSEKDLEWRIQSSGKSGNGIWARVVPYVTNRAIMDRLDEICGPAGWTNKFEQGPDGGVVCGISIKIEDAWLPKYDGAENTNIEPVKGGLSNAMKRAAVQWGIGRYLYGLDETWAVITDNGENRAKTKDGERFKWNPPVLPDWALPENERGKERPASPSPSNDTPATPELTETQKSDLKATLAEAIELGILTSVDGNNTYAEAKRIGPQGFSRYLKSVQARIEKLLSERDAQQDAPASEPEDIF